MAKFRIKEGVLDCFSSGKIERAVHSSHSLLM